MVEIRDLNIALGQKELVSIEYLPIKKTTVLVGQSGSGKSLTLKALLSLLPQAMVSDFSFNAPFDLQRGKTVSFVPQNPFTALSPFTKISKQFFAPQERVKELFDMLSLDWRLYSEFPPNLSGGQLQRVIFAIALIKNPKLLLLDEPTTALDSALREEMISLLLRLQESLGFKMLFVTHEINLAAKLGDYITVLKSGKVVEEGSMQSVVTAPKQEYTKELIAANFENREFRR
jgi:peptide/nickel transport system ATP-binding protein